MCRYSVFIYLSCFMLIGHATISEIITTLKINCIRSPGFAKAMCCRSWDIFQRLYFYCNYHLETELVISKVDEEAKKKFFFYLPSFYYNIIIYLPSDTACNSICTYTRRLSITPNDWIIIIFFFIIRHI